MEAFVDVGLFCLDKTVQASPWGDALYRADSDAAIESFWRWTFLLDAMYLP